MPVELKVPAVGESITEVHIAQWRKRVGQRAEKDENLVELESDKATVDLPAPISGTLTQILKQPGETAQVGEIIGYMAAGAEATAPAAAPTPKPSAAATSQTSTPAAANPSAATSPIANPPQSVSTAAATSPRVMPAAERLMVQEGIPAAAVTPTGPGGRILKEDVQHAADHRASHSTATVAQAAPVSHPASVSQPAEPQLRGEIIPADLARGQTKTEFATDGYPREEELVVMSPIRRRIAQRLVEAQQAAALLTTFNEVDMTEVMALRAKHREKYEKQYGVKLGFMSFFVKAAVDALKHVPQLNAEVRDPHIVYHNYYDIGIAVGGGKGLVVPVLRNAEFMSFAEVEQKIVDFARRAAENKLKLEELQGGTFTISNGGVYGSMLSTPIVNPPQSGILGLHAIQERPAVHNGQVVARPMMFLALTYDHRIVDGREAVMFLKRIKETIEEPTRLLLEI
jgi:2-oxoglutarate dehydrogenase E2 component (dihydrolipoamide succinyltransferase)